MTQHPAEIEHRFRLGAIRHRAPRRVLREVRPRLEAAPEDAPEPDEPLGLLARQQLAGAGPERVLSVGVRGTAIAPVVALGLLEGRGCAIVAARSGLPFSSEAAPPPALARGLIEAIESVHRSGRVHGALHPDNVRVQLQDGACSITLLDLGEVPRRGPREGPAIHAPDLRGLAPEVRDGGVPTRQSDLHGLGAMLSTLVDRLPSAAGPAIRALLSLDPADRPEDTAALRRALELPPPPELPPPQQLPFLGRDDAIERLLEAPSGTRVVIAGPRGSGARRFAVELKPALARRGRRRRVRWCALEPGQGPRRLDHWLHAATSDLHIVIVRPEHPRYDALLDHAWVHPRWRVLELQPLEATDQQRLARFVGQTEVDPGIGPLALLAPQVPLPPPPAHPPQRDVELLIGLAALRNAGLEIDLRIAAALGAGPGALGRLGRSGHLRAGVVGLEVAHPSPVPGPERRALAESLLARLGPVLDEAELARLCAWAGWSMDLETLSGWLRSALDEADLALFLGLLAPFPERLPGALAELLLDGTRLLLAEGRDSEARRLLRRVPLRLPPPVELRRAALRGRLALGRNDASGLQRELGRFGAEPRCAHLLARAALRDGLPEEAEAHLQPALEHDDPLLAQERAALRARAAAARGELRGSLTLLSGVWRQLRSLPEPERAEVADLGCQVLSQMARLAERADRPTEALELWRQADELSFWSPPRHPDHCPPRLARVDLLLRCGRPRQAIPLLELAAPLARWRPLRDALGALALLELGRPELARRRLEGPWPEGPARSQLIHARVCAVLGQGLDAARSALDSLPPSAERDAVQALLQTWEGDGRLLSRLEAPQLVDLLHRLCVDPTAGARPDSLLEIAGRLERRGSALGRAHPRFELAMGLVRQRTGYRDPRSLLTRALARAEQSGLVLLELEAAQALAPLTDDPSAREALLQRAQRIRLDLAAAGGLDGYLDWGRAQLLPGQLTGPALTDRIEEATTFDSVGALSMASVAELDDAPERGPRRDRQAGAILAALLDGLGGIPVTDPLIRSDHRYRRLASALALRSRAHWIGESPASVALRAQVERLASAAEPVLIEGPPGAGRRHLAALLHERAGRRGQLMVVDHPAALAVALEGADGGTLFLRAASSWSQPRIQMALSQRARVWLLIGHDPTAAAAPALLEACSSRRVSIPPLHSRPADIPALAEAFLARLGRSGALGPAALGLLTHHPWPGEAAQLARVIERAARLSAGGALRPSALEAALAREPA